VDRCLTLIEMKQRASQRPNLGVASGATDFVQLANAFGGVGVEVTDEVGLREAVRASLSRDRFTIIAAVIGDRAYDGAF
jgi:acetolactate synthase I/II/III large subunit